MKIFSRGISQYGTFILLAVLLIVFLGCNEGEKSTGQSTPTHMAVAVIPPETQGLQIISSPTQAVLQTSPKPSPTEFGQVVSVTVTEQALKTKAKHVDLVFCLDASGSMGPLLEAAKKRLLDIARDIRNLEQHPTLRVALISYGSSRYGHKDGYVRIDSDFTDNLDTISGKLAGLRAGGTVEYVGRAIAFALDKLSWSGAPDTLKVVFVAGNEPVNQDPMYEIDAVCKKAQGDKVIINTIYCAQVYAARGKEDREWEDLAVKCGGKFSLITLKDAGIALPSGFPSVLPSVLQSLMPTVIINPTPTPTRSAAVKPSRPPTKPPSGKEKLSTFEGQITGIINTTDIMVTNSGYGGLTKTFKLDSKTSFQPSTRRPASGDSIIIYYDSSKPDSAKKIEFLN